MIHGVSYAERHFPGAKKLQTGLRRESTLKDPASPNSYYPMFALFVFMIIAAFIGTQDLGQELHRTLAGSDLGENFALGFCVALMALTFDMTLLSWAQAKKKVLGLD